MLSVKSSTTGAIEFLVEYSHRVKKLLFSHGTVLFVIFSIFSFSSLYLMRESIISNSNAVGYEVVQRLDSSLQVEFEKQKQFVELMAHYADIFLQEHQNDPDKGQAAFAEWMLQTEQELSAKQHNMRIDLYAAIDGQLIAPSHWEDNTKTTVNEARQWYKTAISLPAGTAVILDPYTDPYTNTVITTISAHIGNTNNVIALDLYVESASQTANFASLVPKNYCFYLLDDDGKVILYYTRFDANYTQIQNYVNSFFDSHVKRVDGHELSTTPVTDYIGEQRNVFSTYNAKTGWYTIATTLYSDILFDYHMIYNLFMLMVVIFVILEIWMMWREYHLSSQIETTNEALKVLGNSYQVILRINLKQGTFTTLKAPDLMRLHLASHNNFDDFIAVFADMVIPESRDNFHKNFSLNNMRSLAAQSIHDFGHDYQLKLHSDNRYRWFNARILFDESLDLDESIICFKLIDEEKITEIEEHQLLTDALESAKKNEESKNVFFANMSHDMRTPLNGIIGLCQIGMNHIKLHNMDKLPDIFKKMTTASHQLLTLVDDILDVARPQMESKLTLAPFNIVNNIKENVEVFQANAKQQNKQVNLNFDIRHPVIIGDAAKLRQIVNNLVSNSLKYSHAGCVINVNIREILHLHKPSFMVEVSDTGIGMDREFLKKLFDPYSREQRLSSVQGTGLGLSIVKNIVNIMGGDIKVKSTVNVGTTFTVNLPFVLTDEQKAQAASATTSANTAAAAAPASSTTGTATTDANSEAANTGTGTNADASAGTSTATDAGCTSLDDNFSFDATKRLDPQAQAFMDHFSLKGLNILLVEDNQLNMEIACDILGMKDVKITSAWDGVQAVEIFTNNPAFTFDAILMDMRMPKMDGCEASTTIRAPDKEDAATIPIIACTANAFTEDITATQNAGMNAHVSKPLDFTVLEHVLARVIAYRADFKKLLEIRNQPLPDGTQSDIPAMAAAAAHDSSAPAASAADAANAATNADNAATKSDAKTGDAESPMVVRSVPEALTLASPPPELKKKLEEASQAAAEQQNSSDFRQIDK